MTLSRSYLFVPATRIDRIGKALASDADAVVIDLEDAVSEADKLQARSNLIRWFDSNDCETMNPSHKAIWIRINNISTDKIDNFQKDIELCQKLALKLTGIVLPKVENGESIEHVHQSTDLPIIIQVETARAISNLRAITSKASIKGLYAISYGKLDLCNELNLRLGSQAQQDFINHVRYQILLISKTNKLNSPIESIYPDFTDNQGLGKTANYVADLGFSGMLTIHPKQVTTIHQAFVPSESELSFAKKVVQYHHQTGDAIFAIEGVMVDLPAIKQLQRLLASHYSP